MNSGMPYHFVTLTTAQLEERRVTLDRNGFYAWLSPLVFIGIIFAIRWAGNFHSKNDVRLSGDHLKQPPSTLQVQKRRISWWLDQPLTSEFGARKVHILGVAYAGWLLFLTLRQTGDDYLHLTKRFGCVAVSQLPFQYMMAIKSARNPVQFATSLSHETLNPYHRLFGRIIHLFLATHAILYMNYFFVEKILGQRLMSWDVCLGLTAFWIFNILAFTAIPLIRKAAYHKYFYRLHVVLSGLLMPALFLHVPFARWYVYQMAACYIFNGAARSNSTTVPIVSTVIPIPSTNLVKIRIPGPAWGVPPLMGAGTPGWVPGQHVYIKQSVSPAMPRNPFTVVSLPPREGQDGGDECSNIDLVMALLPKEGQDGGGECSNTNLVRRFLNGPDTTEKGRIDQNVKLFVEGPYGEAARYVPALLQAGSSGGLIMLVAGGVGATFTVPIYLSLLAKRQSTKDIHFIWFVKSIQDAEWGLSKLRTTNVPELDVTVYVTRKNDGILGNGEPKGGLKVFSYGRRPDMKAVVNSVFSPNGVQEKAPSKSFAKVNVLACGPPSMTLALRKEVGKHVMGYGRNVLYHEEAFGLGG
jgi:NAD(P)H-flavin reductase